MFKALCLEGTSLPSRLRVGCISDKNVDLDAYGSAGIALTWNDPAAKIPLTID